MALTITNRPYKFTCVGGSLVNAMTYEFTGVAGIESFDVKDNGGNTIATISLRSATTSFSADIARVASGLFESSELAWTSFTDLELLTNTKTVRSVYVQSDTSNKIFAVRAQIQNESGDFGKAAILFMCGPP